MRAWVLKVHMLCYILLCGLQLISVPNGGCHGIILACVAAIIMCLWWSMDGAKLIHPSLRCIFRHFSFLSSGRWWCLHSLCKFSQLALLCMHLADRVHSITSHTFMLLCELLPGEECRRAKVMRDCLSEHQIEEYAACCFESAHIYVPRLMMLLWCHKTSLTDQQLGRQVCTMHRLIPHRCSTGHTLRMTKLHYLDR